jgi:hypothetical protein
MGPALLDLPTIYHGDTFKMTVTVGPETVDLTGSTFLMQFRKGGVVMKDFSQFVTLDGLRTIEIVIPGDTDPDGTGSFPRPSGRSGDQYNWDLQITAPDNEVRTILRGVAVVEADISYV